MSEKKLALYVHIPFCASKCAYCDFATYPASVQRIEAYVEALCGELQARLEPLGHPAIRSVYIGGGTPSLLSAAQIARVMGAIVQLGRLEADAEVTSEANPGSLPEAKARAWRETGINRLSLGVQSFCEQDLRLLGRAHTRDQAFQAVEAARRAGFANLSLDLIYGLPGQTPEGWAQNLGEALRLDLPHLSCYSLIVEAHTRLRYQLLQGKVPPLPDEDTLLAMDEVTERMTQKAGLARYEVSNYALPGMESRHNLVYWQCEEYLGVGCAAHGDFAGRRTANTASLSLYLSQKEEGRGIPEEDNTPQTRMFERMMMGLRTRQGVDLARFWRDFGCAPEAVWPQSLARFAQKGWTERDAERLFLTPEGLNVMNALLVEMMEERDAPP